MKRFLAVACAAFTLCGALAITGCGQLQIPETNERLDSTEEQLSYRTETVQAYSLEKAYENGFLTQTDLAHAMYYAQGAVYACDEAKWQGDWFDGTVQKLDFAPTQACPALNEQVERDFKNYEYQKYGENYTFEEFLTLYSFRFVGSYNGTFVFTDMKFPYYNHPDDVPPPVFMAGLIWSGSYENDLYIFRYE